ncbi:MULTISPECIES: hypothetical protein [Mycobacterium]|uniref:hypothetical protein n=1 Tax=Mycobacterium TaxID=1763 RepID=UPI0009F4CA43|nr:MULTISPECIES: hypothetical protein [Mycobacterium]MCG7610125.1 hypothetical protein [Mycobacterium sp. CnD-18-1]
MTRVLGSMLIALTLLLAICGCNPLGKNPIAASVPVAFGIRVTDGNLRIWTGLPCPGTTEVDVTFDQEQTDRAELKLAAPGPAAQPGAAPVPGVEVEHLTIGGPYSGFEVRSALPDGFDWRTAETVSLFTRGAPITWGADSELAEAEEHSGEHPNDTYWFQGIGWLNPAEVAEQAGRTFISVCSPDPAKNHDLPRVFGVRVADGSLRIWPGSHCDAVEHVIVTFQPEQADLVLSSSHPYSVRLDQLTIGSPLSDFNVTRPLPGGFDWSSAATVLLRVFQQTNTDPWTTPTDLSPARTESTQHPEDTYWFQGFGWLDPTEVSARDGKDFLTACAQAQ